MVNQLSFIFVHNKVAKPMMIAVLICHIALIGTVLVSQQVIYFLLSSFYPCVLVTSSILYNYILLECDIDDHCKDNAYNKTLCYVGQCVGNTLR